MLLLPVEGTFVARTYTSERELPDGTPLATAILGLYVDDPPSRSLFHRLDRDEVWNFHRGDPLRLVLLHPGGATDEVVLGPDPGQHAQWLVPAGTWQAGELIAGGSWALFGCTVVPGFTDACFEGGAVSTLLVGYPDRADDIRRLGVPDGAPTRLANGPQATGERPGVGVRDPA